MEADDDMIVVIVGDGENEEFPAEVKQEVLDDDEIEKLIETAATHGEFVNGFLKEKIKYEDDTDEWDVDDHSDDDEDTDDESGDEDHSGHRHRHKMLSPAQQRSFVRELRNQYPELVKNSKALITTLSEIMKNVKPPPPPKDFFVMNEVMFECVYCGILSDSQPAAGRHYQEKHGERYLICFACGVDFRSTPNLYRHEKRCTAPDAVVVLKARARMLGRKGRSRPYIPKHIPEPEPVKKVNDRKFPCRHCPAVLGSKRNLLSHELLHSGVRPYTCSICPCSYTSLIALSRHRKKHVEQYICDHCKRVFKMKAALVMHMDTHLPTKRFGCDKCGRRYVTKPALMRHMQKKHFLMLKPCVCQICMEKYPMVSMLKDHMKKDHGLLLMTRRMYFQSLPKLADSQIVQAKIVLKSELEPDISDKSKPKSLLGPPPKVEPIDHSSDESPEHSSEGSPRVMDTICKVEHINQDQGPTEQRIMLSEDVIKYVQSIQGGFNDGEDYKVVVIENSEVNVNYADDIHE